MECTPSPPFTSEEKIWPYVHTLVPAALYIATRRPILSLLIMYVSESLEAIFRNVYHVFWEDVNDALISDPLIGALAILLFWLLDQTTGADIAFRRLVSPWLRFFAFVLVVVATPVANVLDGARVHWGALAYYAIYLFVALVFYHRLLLSASRGALEWTAAQSIVVWLVLTLVYTLVALPNPNGALGDIGSLFTRMLLTSLVFIGLAVALFAAAYVNHMRPAVEISKLGC